MCVLVCVCVHVSVYVYWEKSNHTSLWSLVVTAFMLANVIGALLLMYIQFLILIFCQWPSVR